MIEPVAEQLARVRAMASGDPKWDLSDNDIAALSALLARLAALETDLAIANDPIGHCDACGFHGTVEHRACSACVAVARAALELEP